MVEISRSRRFKRRLTVAARLSPSCSSWNMSERDVAVSAVSAAEKNAVQPISTSRMISAGDDHAPALAP